MSDEPFDGDPNWRVTRVLRDGSTNITIRPVLPEDRDELRRGFLRKLADSRYARFLNLGTRSPSEELLTYLTSVDQKKHVALGATITSADLKTERGIGIARFICLDDHPGVAEAAITVVDDMHRKGVGGVLLHELLRAAKARGVQTIRAEVLADNSVMRGILERARATRVVGEGGDGAIVFDLPLDRIPHSDEAESEPSFFDILRGAAETMALRFRR